jgi:hypothetical protein
MTEVARARQVQKKIESLLTSSGPSAADDGTPHRPLPASRIRTAYHAGLCCRNLISKRGPGQNMSGYRRQTALNVRPVDASSGTSHNLSRLLGCAKSTALAAL